MIRSSNVTILAGRVVRYREDQLREGGKFADEGKGDEKGKKDGKGKAAGEKLRVGKKEFEKRIDKSNAGPVVVTNDKGQVNVAGVNHDFPTEERFWPSPAEGEARLLRNRSESQRVVTKADVKTLQKAVDSRDLAVQVDYSILGKVADDGLLNQFSSMTSNGTLSPGTRATIEGRHFGLTTDTLAEDRPIYGHMLDPKAPTAGAARQYGEIAVIFNDSVRETTTVCDGDSLSYADRIRPAPLGKVDALAAMPHDAKYAYKPGDYSYIEAQIHQRPLTLKHAKELRVFKTALHNVRPEVWKKVRDKYPKLKFRDFTSGKEIDIDAYLKTTAQKRAVIDLSTRAVSKEKRRRFCECDADAIEISEEEE